MSIEWRVAPSAEPDPRTPATVAREFRALLAGGAELRAAGNARRRPERLIESGYVPRSRVDLFDMRFYLSGPRQNPSLRYFVAYVMQEPGASRKRARIDARIFYKDVSLVWRVASHVVWADEDFWIGKGDLTSAVIDGEEMVFSAESTTDLPLEIQAALEELNRAGKRVPYDYDALALVLRHSPPDRIAAYADFTEPRRRAMEAVANRVNRGKPVVGFRRAGVPESLFVVKGFEPDFKDAIVETSHSRSSLYGGALGRYRILSRNRRIQYLFFAGPRHVWIVPPQTTTTELSSYGVRTVDVPVDEDAFVPGYEYHFIDDSTDPGVLCSQIPEGFAGEPAPQDPDRADASAWLDRLPIVREFRKSVLGVRK